MLTTNYDHCSFEDPFSDESAKVSRPVALNLGLIEVFGTPAMPIVSQSMLSGVLVTHKGILQRDHIRSSYLVNRTAIHLTPRMCANTKFLRPCNRIWQALRICFDGRSRIMAL
jgi:hypothetical protein